MALHNCNPTRQLIWHTDRGSQYALDLHRELLEEYDILQSMSIKVIAVIILMSESFFIH